MKRVLIYGGKGALGSKCVQYFKANKYWVASIDLSENPEADYSLTVGKDDNFNEQETKISENMSNVLGENKLDAIICVAGGWAGGNASKDLVKTAETMWKQSGWSSLISASLAGKHLNEEGVLVLTGAKAALEPTPGMIGYGVAKAAVHQLVRSLGSEGSGLPKGSLTTAILPITLDTPMNRKWMPDGDFGTWTPLEFIADMFVKWTNRDDRPANGSLCQLVTKDGVTTVVPA